MFVSASARCSARPAVRSAALALIAALACAILASSPTSQAGAAEGPRPPLGVEARATFSATETFAGEKLGLDDNQNAGQSLWVPSAPRVLAYAGGSGSWDGDTGYQEPAYEESTWYEEPAADEWQEPVEETYDDEVSYEEEPQEVWYTGAASAYSPVCNGGTVTASGVELDWDTPTVASLWLPLGSYIEIYYDGMSVIAQVTDRGPYVSGRDLDLAPGVYAAFGVGSTDEWGVRTVSYRLL